MLSCPRAGQHRLGREARRLRSIREVHASSADAVRTAERGAAMPKRLSHNGYKKASPQTRGAPAGPNETLLSMDVNANETLLSMDVGRHETLLSMDVGANETLLSMDIGPNETLVSIDVGINETLLSIHVGRIGDDNGADHDGDDDDVFCLAFLGVVDTG